MLNKDSTKQKKSINNRIYNLMSKYLSPEIADTIRVIRGDIRGTDVWVRPEIKLTYEDFGKRGVDCCSVYFKDSSDNLIVYSGGIADDTDFERQLLERKPKAELFAFDPTPRSIEYVNTIKLPRFHFLPYALTASDGEFSFYLPTAEEWVSGSLDSSLDDLRKLNIESSISVTGKKISSIMNELGHDHIDILKLDIEGAEFEVLEEAITSGTNILQICVECHHHHFKDGKNRLKKLLKAMSEHGYKIFSCQEPNKVISFIKL